MQIRTVRITSDLLQQDFVMAVHEPTGTPQYQIYDIGVVQVGDEASQGFGVSPAGIAVGRR